MSLSEETAKHHNNDPAVVCCMTRAGAIIRPADLEDPSLFGELEDSGLLDLSGNVLKIGQVIGAKLIKTLNAMTPITPDAVEGGAGTAEAANNTAFAKNGQAGDTAMAVATGTTPGGTGGVVNISIGEGHDIKFSVVLGGGAVTAVPAAIKTATLKYEDKVIRTLKQREFPVEKVELGRETSFEDGVLVIKEQLCSDALNADPLVKKVSLDIITPENKHVHTNTIMDVIPIAVKTEGKLGEGITHVMSGAVVVLTGVDEGGSQVHEFGSCEGYLDEKIRYNRPGCPDEDDILIRVHVMIKEGTGMERRGVTAAHRACDAILQKIREVLKQAPVAEAVIENVIRDVKRIGRPRVVLVKEIMGQGAMHDNLIMPAEPAGVGGGRHNVDLGNVPVLLSANEVRDGGIHALTCVGPSSKETTRHYFREPLVELMAEDEEIDLAGVIFVGSPQVNDEKNYVVSRLGAWAEGLELAGAIVTTEGFGNNHIDFAGHIEQFGKRGIAVVGVTYSAYQGALVVGNKYMDAMIELNEHSGGFESEILADSTICHDDAARALLMLKTKLAGIPIEAADRRWNQTVIEANNKAMETNKKVVDIGER